MKEGFVFLLLEKKHHILLDAIVSYLGDKELLRPKNAHVTDVEDSRLPSM